MKTILSEVKSELKAQAKEIRELKSQRGPSNSGYVHGLLSSKWHYRHKHVAYCLMRGRCVSEIEQKVREGNELSEHLLNKYLERYPREEETLCAC